MAMEIIASLNLFAQANMHKDSDKGNIQPSKTVVSEKVKSGKCEGDLQIPGICDPVCEQIFSDITDNKKAREKAEKLFKETIICDSVCTCICEAICDEFL